VTGRSAKVVTIHPEAATFDNSTERFLRERDLTASTKRVYATTFHALAKSLGADRVLSTIITEDLRGHLDSCYRGASPATFNRNVVTLKSFFNWAKSRRLISEDPTSGLERRKDRRTRRQASVQRAIDYTDLEHFWARRDVPLRLKTLTRMLYETGARASEILGLDIEDLDLAERSGTIIGKGGHAEHVYWATGTARLLPRLLDGRRTGPVFLTNRLARQALANADLDRGTGRARLSYRRAAEEFTGATRWTLHQLRHSALTHLAEDGVDVALLRPSHATGPCVHWSGTCDHSVTRANPVTAAWSCATRARCRASGPPATGARSWTAPHANRAHLPNGTPPTSSQ